MAATNDDDVFQPTEEASIALLRGLRAKTVDRTFVHRVDVCSAVPEELVADLQPVPGTDATEDGYNSMWYFYCRKRYKNTRGEASGHRHRAVEPAGTCWHSEIGAKPVDGMPGATLCNLSYGRMEKKGPSGRKRLDRYGWNMTEFDDTQGGGGDHVLCKVHRSTSSLAKRRFKSSSSSLAKRKAAGDHPEAPPTKLIHAEQVQVQQNPAAYGYPTMPCYGYGPPQGVDPATMVGDEEEENGVQQPRVELEAEHVDGGEFSVEKLLNNMEEFTDTYPGLRCYGPAVPQGVDPVTMVGGEEDHGLQQPEDGGELNLDELFSNDEPVQMQVQQDPAAYFSHAYPTMPCNGYGPAGDVVDPATMVGGEECDVQQQRADELEAEHVDAGEFNVEELLNMEEFTEAHPTTTTTMPGNGHGGPQGEEEEHGVQHQQPRVDSETEHGGDMGGFNLEELLNTNDWKSFLQMLQAEGEQGQQQQPSDEPEHGQYSGIVISGDLLYAC